MIGRPKTTAPTMRETDDDDAKERGVIVVTGAGGVLGKALAEELGRGSEPVHLLSRDDADLLDTDRTIAAFKALKPRIVYHLAGRVHGLGGNARFPADVFRDNVRINTNVIEAAALGGCEKIVAVSTVAIYNTDAPKPVRETWIWEGEPHGGERAYGHAKRAMLAMLQAYRDQYGLAFAYPIMTNLYGPQDRFDPVYGHVIPSLVTKFHRNSRDRTPIEIWGTGVAERDFLFASDAARALMLIADRHEGPINVATGEAVPIRTAVDLLQQHTGLTDISWDASKPNGELRRRYDVSTLAALGFRPEVSLAEGLARTYDWYAAAYPDVRTYS
jgi:GDP-L-fucose synthase